MTHAVPQPRRVGRSVAAVLSGFVAVFVLSLGTDEVLHVLAVYPPWGQPMSDGLFLLATAYRVVYTVVGGYLTARLAPHAPVRHAVMVAVAKPGLGPLWYPIAIAVAALPGSWLGAVLYSRRHVGGAVPN